MKVDDTSDTRGALCRKSPMRARMERFMQTGVLASLVSPRGNIRPSRRHLLRVGSLRDGALNGRGNGQ